MPKTDSFFSPDQYATVAERIELFYSRFPLGRINTELVGRADGEITFKALVYRSADDTFAAATGWASEREGDSDINTVACLENTETSAVGRALANLGFTASSKRPSREEMEKVGRLRARLAVHEREPAHGSLSSNALAREDLLRLVATSRHAGLSERRAAILSRAVIQAPGASAARIRKIELSLRAWITRKEL